MKSIRRQGIETLAIVVAFFVSLFAVSYAQTPGSGPNVFGAGVYGPAYSNAKGHWLYGAGKAPAVSTCGTSPVQPVGTDATFLFSSGATASGACTITPAIAYAKQPICVVDTNNATKPSKTVSATGVITLGAVQDSTQYSVVCYAQPGGL